MDDSSPRRKLWEREKKKLLYHWMERNGDASVFACVCAVLRKIHWADGPTLQRASHCGNPRRLLRLPIEAGPVLVLCLGCGGGVNGAQKGAQTERSQIQRPSIDVSLSSLGIYFGNSTGISSIMSTVNSWTECEVFAEKHTIFQMFNI